MNTVILKQGSTAWHALHFTDGKPCSLMISIFGTHELPTAFTIAMPLAQVMANLQMLMPNALIQAA